ncbi:Germin 11-1 [Hyphodiscus hymeniophilus]|uniref:Germin 11-1 n=1 Tax=Hyphodiscus hymeniophilus TaxID=353542 RepID=A0A9P7AZ05_9HELO|nr:Germin 11-1 [Hyphodiscus hymeniophilus]
MHPKISVPSVLSQITEVYSPNLVANLNKEYDIKIARTQGEFIWHSHPDTDEVFYILSGTLTIEIEGDQGREEDVVLNQGDVFVVPMGARHKPVGDAEIMLIEKVGVVNTGDEEESEMTKQVADARVRK